MVEAGLRRCEVSGDAIAGGPAGDVGFFAVLKPEDVDGIAMDIGDVVLAAASLPETVEGIDLAVVVDGGCDECYKGDGGDDAGYYCDSFLVGVHGFMPLGYIVCQGGRALCHGIV